MAQDILKNTVAPNYLNNKFLCDLYRKFGRMLIAMSGDGITAQPIEETMIKLRNILSDMNKNTMPRYGLYDMMFTDGQFILDLYTKKLRNAKRRYELDSMVPVSGREGTGIIPMTTSLVESTGLKAYGFRSNPFHLLQPDVRDRIPIRPPENSRLALLHDYNALYDPVFEALGLCAESGSQVPYLLTFYRHDEDTSKEFYEKGVKTVDSILDFGFDMQRNDEKILKDWLQFRKEHPRKRYVSEI